MDYLFFFLTFTLFVTSKGQNKIAVSILLDSSIRFNQQWFNQNFDGDHFQYLKNFVNNFVDTFGISANRRVSVVQFQDASTSEKISCNSLFTLGQFKANVDGLTNNYGAVTNIDIVSGVYEGKKNLLSNLCGSNESFSTAIVVLTSGPQFGSSVTSMLQSFYLLSDTPKTYVVYLNEAGSQGIDQYNILTRGIIQRQFPVLQFEDFQSASLALSVANQVIDGSNVLFDVTAWSTFSLCSIQCTQTRSRNCTGPCIGVETSQTINCTTDLCPSIFSLWTSFSECSVLCQQTRSRNCSRNCQNAATSQTQACLGGLCPTVLLGDWSAFGVCSSSCQRQKIRNCTGNCQNISTSYIESCVGDLCPTNILGVWSSFGSCSVLCQQTRNRTCIGNCQSSITLESQSCVGDLCPTVILGEWSSFGNCSSICQQTRSRSCTGSCQNIDILQVQSCMGDSCLTGQYQVAVSLLLDSSMQFNQFYYNENFVADHFQYLKNFVKAFADAFGISANHLVNVIQFQDISTLEKISCDSSSTLQSFKEKVDGLTNSYSSIANVDIIGGIKEGKKRLQSSLCGNNDGFATAMVILTSGPQPGVSIDNSLFTFYALPDAPNTYVVYLNQVGSQGTNQYNILTSGNVQRQFPVTQFTDFQSPLLARSVANQVIANSAAFLGAWSPFSNCSSTCQQTKSRNCSGNCKNAILSITQPCLGDLCSTVIFGPWTTFSNCSFSCLQSRSRTCNGNCQNASVSEVQSCLGGMCPTVILGAWSSFGNCSNLCQQSRNRTCSGNCQNMNVSETQSCSGGSCSNAGEWSSFGSCSSLCQQTRSRTCTENCQNQTIYQTISCLGGACPNGQNKIAVSLLLDSSTIFNDYFSDPVTNRPYFEHLKKFSQNFANVFGVSANRRINVIQFSDALTSETISCNSSSTLPNFKASVDGLTNSFELLRSIDLVSGINAAKAKLRSDLCGGNDDFSTAIVILTSGNQLGPSVDSLLQSIYSQSDTPKTYVVYISGDFSPNLNQYNIITNSTVQRQFPIGDFIDFQNQSLAKLVADQVVTDGVVQFSLSDWSLFSQCSNQCQKTRTRVCTGQCDKVETNQTQNCTTDFCPSNPCAGKTDGKYLIPDVFAYLVCSMQLATFVNCSENQIFDPNYSNCMDAGNCSLANFCVGKTDGQYRNPWNCNGFISCSNSIAYNMSCAAPNLVYDSYTNQCKDTGVSCSSLTTLGEWSTYGNCSVVCQQTRVRTCSGNCQNAITSQSQKCLGGSCPNALYSIWSAFSECSTTCQKTRTRNCTGNCGNAVVSDVQNCTDGQCPSGYTFSDWGAWSSCSQSCRATQTNPMRARARSCFSNSTLLNQCTADLMIKYEPCNTAACLTVKSCSSTNFTFIFVLDSSSSINNQEWIQEKQYVKNFVNNSEFGSNPGIEVALVNFGTYAKLETSCGAITNKNDFFAFIDGLQMANGGTAINDALLTAEVTSKNCTRLNVSPVFILLTDGFENIESNYTKRVETENRLKSKGLLYAGAVGSEVNKVDISRMTRYIVNGQDVYYNQFADSFTDLVSNYSSTFYSYIYGILGCETKGQWTTWSDWSACSVVCGVTGYVQRIRSCVNPSTGKIQEDCEADRNLTNLELNICSGPCGTWTNWGPYTDCSETCQSNIVRPPTQSRQRFCINNTLELCLSDNGLTKLQTIPCNVGVICPIRGTWGSWGAWSTCNASCDSGVTQRARNCSLPVPANAGSDCIGDSAQQKACKIFDCPKVCMIPKRCSCLNVTKWNYVPTFNQFQNQGITLETIDKMVEYLNSYAEDNINATCKACNNVVLSSMKLKLINETFQVNETITKLEAIKSNLRDVINCNDILQNFIGLWELYDIMFERSVMLQGVLIEMNAIYIRIDAAIVSCESYGWFHQIFGSILHV